MTLCRVEVASIYLDESTGSPIVVLKDTASDNVLPILIAPLEASLIAIELEGKRPARPLTHDLIASILAALQWSVESVVVEDLRNNIFYAKITLVSGETRLEIDSRPSDAIALSLRTRSPIFVRKKVFALAMGIEQAVKKMDEETLREMLEDMEIDDAGGKMM
ncbi:MAG: bifunctional nuclease family protein [Spirochaetes bacterium]|nr:MAG: bifunctional nuclease family protein [Spirochaetota bacterium]